MTAVRSPRPSDDILHTHGPFSTRHRIIDTASRVHRVVVVGDRGAAIGTHGFYIDVSTAPDQDVVTKRLAEIAENRAGIEQAKRMPMLVYDIDGDGAFNLLKWLSQQSNVKLRPLAEQNREGLPR